jgi:nitroreductase
MSLSSSFEEIIQHRRSNRKFDANVEVPDDVIVRSLERSILSPNSSNMQLWEFQWIKDPALKESFTALCLDQNAARTSKQLVVFVTRKDLWKQRAAWNYNKIKEGINGEPNTAQKRGLDYYGKLMPLAYRSDIFGITTLIRRALCFFMGLRKPFMRFGGDADQRVTVHKSCALAAQTFMLSIAAEGFESCPMEGFDAIRVKRALQLPAGAEINMIIAVGKGTEAGVWGPRFRVPYNEVVVVR